MFINLHVDKVEITSTNLFENPHSLSYHARILQNFLFKTFVSLKSTIALFGLWLKSLETSGSEVV